MDHEIPRAVQNEVQCRMKVREIQVCGNTQIAVDNKKILEFCIYFNKKLIIAKYWMMIKNFREQINKKFDQKLKYFNNSS